MSSVYFKSKVLQTAAILDCAWSSSGVYATYRVLCHNWLSEMQLAGTELCFDGVDPNFREVGQ